MFMRDWVFFAAVGRILCSTALFVAIVAALGASGELRAADRTNSLPRYELRIAAKDLRDLDRDLDGDRLRPATFVADGKQYEVKVRLRGAWARTWLKRPLKIFFEKGKDFEANHCLNLNTGWRDPAFVREPLAYQIYAACGVPAPRARMVELLVNGAFRGLYVEVEQPKKAFLKRNHLDGGAIYKANSEQNLADERDLGNVKAFATHYEKENRKTEDCRDLQSFCHQLAITTNDVLAFFTRNVDLDEYVSYLAAGALLENWDCLNKNHFLVHDDRGSGKWVAVPWDLDRTLGDHWRGGFNSAQIPVFTGVRRLPGPTGWNRLADAFFNDKTLRNRFIDRLENLVEKEFTAEKLFPILDRFEAEIGALAAQDRARWPSPAGGLHEGIQEVKQVIQARREFVLREIARLRAADRKV